VSGVTVVVDFGATDTVGVLRGHDGVPRPVRVGGEVRVPSAVALSPEDQLVVGRDAVSVGAAEPERVVGDLKHRLDRRDLMVGDIVLPVTRLVRTLLARVVRAAGTPVTELVLTHPADWPDERVAVLTRAAAGLAPSVRTVTAPLAAFAGADLEGDQTVLVVELDGDGGTASTVRRKGGRPAVLSTTELPVDAEVAKLAAAADAVLVVGRSSRTPVLARRLAEQGLPVRVDQDPATAVARGALSAESAAPERPAFVSGRTRPWLRRAIVAAAGLVIVAAIGAVLAIGVGPGLRMAGNPGPAAGALVNSPDEEGGETMPPVVEGQELVGAGRPAYVTARQGLPAQYRTATGAALEITVKAVRPAALQPALGDAPAGYRWMTVELTGANKAGPDWDADFSRAVSLVDDRGLWIHPLGDGVVDCTATASKPPRILPKGQTFDACVAVPVPERTPVTAVVFGALSTDPDAQRPIRVPVSVPAVPRGAPATPLVAGKLGEAPVEVTIADAKMRAGFDVVLTPSGYLGDRKPAAGNRLVIVRAALGPADDVFLRDDRGVLTRPVPGFDRLTDCPPFVGPGTADKPVYACFVYELAAKAKVAGVTYGDLAADAPLSGRDVERWPTWTT
jgi:hypothetical protein